MPGTVCAGGEGSRLATLSTGTSPHPSLAKPAAGKTRKRTCSGFGNVIWIRGDCAEWSCGCQLGGS